MYNLISDKLLFKSIILEINKSFDSIITKIYSKSNVKYSSTEKKFIRNEVYYKFINNKFSNKYKNLYNLFWDEVNQNLIDKKFNEALEYTKSIASRSNKERERIEGTIISRSKSLNLEMHYKDINKLFKNYILEKERNKDNLQIINIENKKIKEFGLNFYFSLIKSMYERLNNFGYLAVIFDDSYTDINKWSLISKISIFCENFMRENNFSLFNKNKSKFIDILKSYLKENKYIQFDSELNDIIEEFYSCVSYGFNFTDLFISNDAKKNILIMQKVELDEKMVPCPDCFSMESSGNSYTKVLQKSFECSNSKCISRSKSGRGKRYNYISAKLQYKKFNLNYEDYVPDNIYKNFRRDIFDTNIDIITVIIHLYTFSKENILIYGLNKDNIHSKLNRNILYHEYTYTYEKDNFNELKIIKLMNKIYLSIINGIERYSAGSTINIINDNSTDYLYSLKNNIFNLAITSPPYYNAREYSKWDNLILYFIDMMINSKYLYDKISLDGIYLYNIGDIVARDNIYVNSNMSNTRQMLGSYTVAIFELIGWNIKGNIIWDKGEVQSKRNSTTDLLPHYVKTINCYEHIYIFSKSNSTVNEINEVKCFSPVIKIDRTCNNTLGHTAPYPLELVDNIEQFCKKDSTILDPFLGSGTTAIWAKKYGYNCIGIEMNKDYYELCLNRVFNNY